MQEIQDFLVSLIQRASSRSFVVSVAVLWFIATHPELSVEQLIGLLIGTGIVTSRAVIEDRVEATKTKADADVEMAKIDAKAAVEVAKEESKVDLQHVNPPIGTEVAPDKPKGEK